MVSQISSVVSTWISAMSLFQNILISLPTNPTTIVALDAVTRDRLSVNVTAYVQKYTIPATKERQLLQL